MFLGPVMNCLLFFLNSPGNQTLCPSLLVPPRRQAPVNPTSNNLMRLPFGSVRGKRRPYSTWRPFTDTVPIPWLLSPSERTPQSSFRHSVQAADDAKRGRKKTERGFWGREKGDKEHPALEDDSRAAGDGQERHCQHGSSPGTANRS